MNKQIPFSNEQKTTLALAHTHNYFISFAEYTWIIHNNRIINFYYEFG